MIPETLFMSQHDQLLWGSVVLSACALIHVGLLAGMIEALAHIGRWVKNRNRMVRTTTVVGAAFVMIVSSHTVQVWLWAAVLLYMDAFEYLYDALYFSLVTYTTVGYGDVVLPVEFRVFGAFGGVSGILALGFRPRFWCP
ncbi:MAG: potassium channel family protein [Pseudomonadota bacterium]|nr:potassium channel family protein [Pseudomonadota bacterium]